MANKINFITGETYTLAELFSGERQIIIPDLQRDYCWGNDDNIRSTGEIGELVTGFVNNLIDQFCVHYTQNENGTLNLGLFYGYEVPANHIQLCDGQQRLTTIYLLLGIICKRTHKFRQHLISDYEFLHDDKEPYLNYAIRESSIYFLSDLVCQFFIEQHEKITVEDIKSAEWYYDEYNLDPSIQSILNALSKIDLILKDKEDRWLIEFGDWLLNKVTFLYYDMGTRRNGEETFVVINTTGESLSATQNLKPLVILEKNDMFDNTVFCKNDKGIDQCWEEIETWFWKNRNKKINDTADAGFAEFLRWVSIIEQFDEPAPEEDETDSIKWSIQLILQGKKCEFPYKKISFECIYEYWEALKWLYDENVIFKLNRNYLSPEANRDVNNRHAIDQKQCFVLLPLLKYVRNNILDIESDPKQKNAKRVYEFFNNLIRIDNVQKSVNTLVRDALQIVQSIKNGDIVDILDCADSISGQLLTEEEKLKLKILKRDSENREKIEKAFWKAQEHPIWNGEILPMIEWANTECFCIDTFNSYKDIIPTIFSGNCDSNIDPVRRALLTKGLAHYPRIFTGYTNYSFGWRWSDWQTLINDNKDKFKFFFDELLKGEKLQSMIDKYNNKKYVFYRFVKYPELLAYCEQKNIQKWGTSYCLVKNQRAKGPNYLELETACLFLEISKSKENGNSTTLTLESECDLGNGWKMCLRQGSSTLVFNNTTETVEVHFDPQIGKYALKDDTNELSKADVIKKLQEILGNEIPLLQ